MAYTKNDTNAWWLKVGVKRALNSLGDTSISFNYGQYSDQYGSAVAGLGVTSSELERIGFSVDQYFGSRLIVYDVWENLEVSTDCGMGATVCQGFNSADDLNLFFAGLTFF